MDQILKTADYNLGDMKQIIQRFGGKILIILDGYEKKSYGSNRDLVDLIEGKSRIKCTVMLTTRTMEIMEHEKNFNDTFIVQGFTKNHAEEFAAMYISEKDKIAKILNFVD